MYVDLRTPGRRKWRRGTFKPYRRESFHTRHKKSLAAIARQERLRIARAALIAASITLGGCATIAEKPPAAVTPFERVAIIQKQIVETDGHAGPDLIADYSRALIETGQFAQACDALDESIDPAAPLPRALNYRGACRAELGNIVGARADFGEAIKLGDQAAVANLAKLPPDSKVAATSHHPQSVHRTSGHPTRSKIAAKPLKIHWLEKPL